MPEEITWGSSKGFKFNHLASAPPTKAHWVRVSQRNGTLKAWSPRIPGGPTFPEHLQSTQQQVLSAMFPWKKQTGVSNNCQELHDVKNYIHADHKASSTWPSSLFGGGVQRIRDAFRLATVTQHTLSQEMTSP